MTRKTKTKNTSQDYGIEVTGRHVLVTDPMKDYAREKLSKIERFNLRIVDVVVTMDIQKIRHIVDIILKVNDFKIKSSAVSDDMYASIDLAVEKIQAQLRKYKKKLTERQAKGLQVIDMNVNVLAPAVDEDLLVINDEIDDETRRHQEAQLIPHEIVQRETRPMKILSQEEAIMKMELSGDFFLIYRSEEDRKIKVIYRRTDGNYGVIEPE